MDARAVCVLLIIIIQVRKVSGVLMAVITVTRKAEKQAESG